MKRVSILMMTSIYVWEHFALRWNLLLMFWESQDCQAHNWLTICRVAAPPEKKELWRNSQESETGSRGSPNFKVALSHWVLLFYCCTDPLLTKGACRNALITLSHLKPRCFSQVNLNIGLSGVLDEIFQSINPIQGNKYQEDIFLISLYILYS